MVAFFIIWVSRKARKVNKVRGFASPYLRALCVKPRTSNVYCNYEHSRVIRHL